MVLGLLLFLFGNATIGGKKIFDIIFILWVADILKIEDLKEFVQKKSNILDKKKPTKQRMVCKNVANMLKYINVVV